VLTGGVIRSGLPVCWVVGACVVRALPWVVRTGGWVFDVFSFFEIGDWDWDRLDLSHLGGCYCSLC
jgi:hypothetical protein